MPTAAFSAAEYAESYDDPTVTVEDVLGHFPPDTKSKLAEIQSDLESLTPTYSLGASFSAEREQLHLKIIEEVLSPDVIARATPPEGQQPTFTMLGGRGGSGKSWFRNRVYSDENVVLIDADAIKGMLPEYKGWNAAQVHEESGFLVERITELARELGLNVVIDKTMKSLLNAMAEFKAFEAAGYAFELYYMFLPRQKAAERAVRRFLGGTRYVPIEVVLSNTDNERNFDVLAMEARVWRFYDNDVDQGDNPVEVARGPKEG